MYFCMPIRRSFDTHMAELAASSSGQAVVLELASPQPDVLPVLRYSEAPALLDAFTAGGNCSKYSSGSSNNNTWSVGDITGTKVWDSLPVLWHALSCGALSASIDSSNGGGCSTHSQDDNLNSSRLILGPELVMRKRVLELGAGSGLLGIGCSILGASEVLGSD